MAPQPVQSIGRGAFRLPDGFVAYTAKRAAAEYKKLSPVAYTAADVILLLLSSQDRPVAGRTLLFKELFLFEKEVLAGESVEDCKFVPHYYGPYSFYMACKVREMARRGLIEISGGGGGGLYVRPDPQGPRDGEGEAPDRAGRPGEQDGTAPKGPGPARGHRHTKGHIPQRRVRRIRDEV